MAKINYQITEHLGVISESKSGWRKELNLVSWNDREPKYDIRDWAPEYEKMGKGMTFSKEELLSLASIIGEANL